MGGCLSSPEETGSSPSSICFPSFKVSKIKKLGHGGFAQVFLVRDTFTKELFAMKVLNTGSPELKTYAQQELHVLRDLGPKSPGLLSLIDTFNSLDQRCFILLKYYRNGTTQDLIESQRAIRGLNLDQSFFPFENEKRILTLMIEPIKGIKVLHDNGLCHHDIKPANLLLPDDPDDHAVLMDFGSVFESEPVIDTPSQRSKLQEKAEELCSIMFRPPELFEVWSGTVINERTDVWSLGCTLYTLAFGVSPFDYVISQSGSMKMAVAGGKINFPDSSPYSTDFVDLIKSMVRVVPESRPSISEILDKAEELLVL